MMNKKLYEQFKKALTPMVQRIMNEMKNYYSVEYYAKIGQHGELGTKGDFNSAYRDAINLYKREKKNGNLTDDETWYIGVTSGGDTATEFAIVYINQLYFDYVKQIASNAFSSSNDAKMWLSVANKSLKTGNPVKGTFQKTVTKEDNLNESKDPAKEFWIKIAGPTGKAKTYRINELKRSLSDFTTDELLNSTMSVGFGASSIGQIDSEYFVIKLGIRNA